MRMQITEKTALQEIYGCSLLEAAREYLIGNGAKLFRTKGSATLLDINHEQPTWYAGDMAFGLNRLLEISENEKTYIHSVYTPEEMEKEPDKKDVCLFHFPGNKGDSYVILMAGGGYGCVCSMAEAFPVAAKLNEMGITAFCLNYRTGQPGLLPKPMEDLSAAWRYIEANSELFHVNPGHYAVGGFSAGGHAAAMWGMKELGYRNYHLPRPQLLMLAYPFISSVNAGQKECEILFTVMCGGDYTPETLERYFIDRHIDTVYPPVYIVHSQDDSTVPIENAESMAAALHTAGVVCKSEFPPTGGHGFGLGTNSAAAGWVERAVQFWQRNQTKTEVINK